MPAYIISDVTVKDRAAMEEYRTRAAPTIALYGGRYLVRGGDVKTLEGNLPIHRLVVLEFPSVEAAQHFYDSPEYQPLLKIRLASTKSDLVLAAGHAS